MKGIEIVNQISFAKVGPVARIRRGAILGALVFTVVVSSGPAGSHPSANYAVQQSADVQQSQTTHATEEEENTYRAAKQEPDPRKRAEKLYAYFQKYPRSVLMLRADFEEIRPIENEYSAYYAALQESDIQKRAASLINFLQVFPNSAAAKNIKDDYLQMLRASAQEKKYELLESLTEKWLKLQPDDRQVHAFAVEASMGLKDYRKAGENLESLYKMQPSIALAREIIAAYENTGDMDKQVEWGEKLFQLPELAGDYMLRYSLAMQFYKREEFQKAAEYSRLTIKSAELAKPQNAADQEQLQKVRGECYGIIAGDLLEREKYADAISIYEQAIKEHRYTEGYYRIGQILDKQKEIEEATHYYAMAELVGGEDALKAKARLEVLYKALHNDTLIGIEKVYKKAKETLSEPESKS
jgi:tetratricopeptide (TPR) repeat protein